MPRAPDAALQSGRGAAEECGGGEVTDPIDKEAEAAWSAWYGGPPDYALEHDGFIAGFRAARSAAPVAPSDNRACGKSYGPMSVMCRRLAGHVGDCGPSAGDELVTVQLAEARARGKHLQELERKGEDIGDLHTLALRAGAHQADSQGSAPSGEAVAESVAPSEPKPEAVAIPCPNCAPARHEAAQCLLCAGSGAIGKVKSEPEAVRPTDGELETLRVFIDLAKRYLPENAKLADAALSELERRLNRG